MNKSEFFIAKLILCITGIIGAVTIGFSIGVSSVIEFIILIVGIIACILFAFVGDV